jgi:hypothetical protein
MFKRSTWITLAICLVLVGVVIYLQKSASTATPAPFPETPLAFPTMDYLFPANNAAVTSILIETKEGKSLKLERVKGVWKITKPFEAAADQSSVEQAASQVIALPILDRLDLNTADVGLTTPAYTITIVLSSGQTLVAQIGDETPTGSGYYVRKEGGPVLVVDKYGILALTGMLDAPPYVETPTPSPTPVPPTATLTPTGIPVSETPTATKTP